MRKILFLFYQYSSLPVWEVPVWDPFPPPKRSSSPPPWWSWLSSAQSVHKIRLVVGLYTEAVCACNTSVSMGSNQETELMHFVSKSSDCLMFLCHCRGHNTLYKTRLILQFPCKKWCLKFQTSLQVVIIFKITVCRSCHLMGQKVSGPSKSLDFVPGPFRILEMAQFCDFQALVS